MRQKKEFNKNMKIEQIIVQRDELEEMVLQLKNQIDKKKLADAVADTQR